MSTIPRKLVPMWVMHITPRENGMFWVWLAAVADAADEAWLDMHVTELERRGWWPLEIGDVVRIPCLVIPELPAVRKRTANKRKAKEPTP